MPVLQPEPDALTFEGLQLPAKVRLLLGGRWLPATAHGLRNGRRGAQVLVSCEGRFAWVSATRLRRQSAEPDAPATAASDGGTGP